MSTGLIVTNEGLCRVPIEVSIQRSGLPQLVLQGIAGKAQSLRHSIMAACKATNVVLPRGRVIIQCHLPPAPIYGAEGLAAAIVVALTQPDHDVWPVVVGALHLNGEVSCPPELFGAVQAFGPEKLIVGKVPPKIEGWASQRVLIATSLENLLKKKWVKPVVPVPLRSPFSEPSPTLLSLDSLHLLALALVWAGGHSLLLFGSPGEGKTRSRQWLEAMAPFPSPAEQATWSSLNPLQPSRERVYSIPVSASLAQWGGSPSGWLRQIVGSVAWQDELPEVSSSVRTRWRAWLDSTDVQLQKFQQRGGVFRFVATMNPCPCGYWGEPRCTCSSPAVAAALRKVSWPLLDRFALQWRVESSVQSIPAAEVRKQYFQAQENIRRALRAQQQRWAGEFLNAQADFHQLSGLLQEEFSAWQMHVTSWSPRRQVMLVQVAQTLLDGQWSKTPTQAFELAWQLCRGAETLRPGLTGLEIPAK